MKLPTRNYFSENNDHEKHSGQTKVYHKPHFNCGAFSEFSDFQIVDKMNELAQVYRKSIFQLLHYSCQFHILTLFQRRSHSSARYFELFSNKHVVSCSNLCQINFPIIGFSTLSIQITVLAFRTGHFRYF